MNMEALGGYLKGLRLARDLTPAEVATALKSVLGRNIDPATIWRVETADMKPKADLFLAMLSVLRGNATEAWGLIQRKDATAQEGETLGRRAAVGEGAVRTVEQDAEQLASILRQVNPRRRDALLELLRRAAEQE